MLVYALVDQISLVHATFTSLHAHPSNSHPTRRPARYCARRSRRAMPSSPSPPSPPSCPSSILTMLGVTFLLEV